MGRETAEAMKKIIIIFLVTLYPNFSNAANVMGDKLFKYCSAYALGEQIYCVSYVQGIADGINVAQTSFPENQRKFCLPKILDTGLVKIIITDHLEKHSKQQNLPAATTVSKVLQETYPCKKQ